MKFKISKIWRVPTSEVGNGWLVVLGVVVMVFAAASAAEAVVVTWNGVT